MKSTFMRPQNIALQKLIEQNPVLYRDDDFMARFVSQLSFDRLYELYSQQLPDHKNILDDEKVIEAIITENDAGKSLVVALFAANDLFGGFTLDSMLKVADISPAHKKALLSNTRIDWYGILIFNTKEKAIKELFNPIFLDDKQHDYRKIIFQNPRMDRGLLAKLIAGRDEYAALDIRHRIYYGVEAAQAKEIESYNYRGKDSPDSNELRFDDPLKVLLSQMRIAFANEESAPWLRPLFTCQLIAAYLERYSLPTQWSEWLTPEQEPEIKASRVSRPK
jgi:hypothetical protein